MPVSQVPPALMDELQDEIGKDGIDRGFRRLNEFKFKYGKTLKSSQAKDNWSSIAEQAEKGNVTFIERRGVMLAVVPVGKMVAMAAQMPSQRTMGDILDAYPGVNATAAPRATTRGGTVRSLRLPEGAVVDPEG